MTGPVGIGSASLYASMPALENRDREPEVSVVVIFHDRTRFLVDALHSVIAPAPTTRFEILVVGPQHPAEIARFEQEGTARWVPSPAVSLGAKVARGLEEARGELVTFLEDDDRFRPGKVDWVRAHFQRSPSLGYLQNGFTIINEAGRRSDTAYYKGGHMRRWQAQGPIRLPARPSRRDLLSLAPIPVSHNLSSISIRRWIARDQTRLLEEIAYPLDLGIFAVALVAPTEMRFDPNPMTEIRVHGSSFSNPAVDRGSVEDLGLRRASERNWIGRHMLDKFVRERGEPEVVETWGGLTAIGDINHYLRVPEVDRRTVAGAWLRSVERWNTAFVQSSRALLLPASVSMFSPRFGSRLYFEVRRLTVGGKR